MFDRHITQKDICDKWAKFKVGDSVVNISEFNTGEGVFKIGTKFTVEDVSVSFNPPVITLSEVNDYELINRCSDTFKYRLKDEHDNKCVLNEYSLVVESTEEKDRNETAIKMDKIKKNENKRYILLSFIFIISFLCFFISLVLLGSNLKIAIPIGIASIIGIALSIVLSETVSQPYIRKIKKVRNNYV